MEIIRNKVIYTADDEEPDCGICDNQCYSECCQQCGNEYAWGYYKREEYLYDFRKRIRDSINNNRRTR